MSTYKCFALLISDLAQVSQSTELSPHAMFIVFVQHLIARVPAAATQAEEGKAKEDDNEDEILGKVGKDYEHILLFLWACYHHGDVISSPTLRDLQDDSGGRFAQTMHPSQDPTSH